MSSIRIVQYFELLAFAKDPTEAASLANASTTDTVTLGKQGGSTVYHRYQNYFVNETVKWPASNGKNYDFVPFQVQGTVSSIGGDNTSVQVLFPNVPVAIRLVQQGQGNRLSRLTLTTAWLNATNALVRSYEERYVGIGASFSETTIELRFRSAMDSVGSKFPSRSLSRANAGLLPLNANLQL